MSVLILPPGIAEHVGSLPNMIDAIETMHVRGSLLSIKRTGNSGTMLSDDARIWSLQVLNLIDSGASGKSSTTIANKVLQKDVLQMMDADAQSVDRLNDVGWEIVFVCHCRLLLARESPIHLGAATVQFT